jgi:hypothetical protein
VTFEPVPRAAIAADGTSAAAWRTVDGRLVASTGSRSGRFTPPRTVARAGAIEWWVAAAPGGAALVAWQAHDGAWVAVRRRAGRPFVRRHIVALAGSDISGIEAVADPGGGWVVAERRYPPYGSGLPYRVFGSSLDEGGRLLGPPQDLGEGSFGLDARPGTALAAEPDGGAVLAFTGEGGRDRETTLVSVRPHGGAFGAPVAVPGPPTAEPRAVAGPEGTALLAFLRIERCGDAGCFGAPGIVRVGADGALSAPAGPALEMPRRALSPSVAPVAGGGAVLVFGVKPRPAAFSREATVRAVAVGRDGSAGPVLTLSSRLCSEPVAAGLRGGRALALWAERGALRAALADVDGRFRGISAPPGPAPERFHTNSTNRQLATAGRWALAAWSRAGRVRLSVRRF